MRSIRIQGEVDSSFYGSGAATNQANVASEDQRADRGTESAFAPYSVRRGTCSQPALRQCVLQVTLSFHREKSHGLRPQRRTSRSIGANLAEGCGRGGDASTQNPSSIASRLARLYIIG